MAKCETCNTVEDFDKDSKSELRPYGPGGSLICYRCAFADEESEKRTEAAFDSLMSATFAVNDPVIIGGTAGERQALITELSKD